MKTGIKIAVISDLHVGDKARAKDLCPGDSTAPETGYRQRFVEFVVGSGLKADYLIIPGDVSNKAHPAEFGLASESIREFASALGVDERCLLFVPGNHDVNWDLMSDKNDSTGFGFGQRYAPLAFDKWIFRSILSRSSGPGILLDAPFFSTWEYPDLVVVGYNSSSHDGPGEEVHHGLISNESIERIEKFLDGIDLSPSRLKIFLVHHHPVQYSDPIPDEADFSAMTNAGNLLRLLRRKKFDFVIHGHKHSPRFETHIIDSSFPLAVLCAGSFSAILDTRWSGYVNNQFHMIEVEGRDGEAECVFGVVKSWTYLCGRGWLESQPNNGIPHVLPFGTYMLPAVLKSILEPRISDSLAMGSYVEWSHIIKDVPRLKHLQPERIVEVLDDLAPRLSFKRHGTPPDEVVLLKL